MWQHLLGCRNAEVRRGDRERALIGKVIRAMTKKRWGTGVAASPKAQRLAALCQPFGCQATAVRALIEELSGEKIPEQKQPWVIGSLSVPTGKAGGHNYTLGFPFMCVNADARHLDSHGDLGNTMGIEVRMPTAAEVEKFIRDLDVAKTTQYLCGMLNILRDVEA